MKNIRIISVLLFVFSVFMVSCSADIEPLDPAIQVPGDGNGNGGGGNNGGGGDDGGGVSTGDYWPMTVNNQWVFAQDGVDQSPMKIVSTQQIDGKTHYKYENFLGTSTLGSSFEGLITTRKSNGVYYYRAEVNIPSVDGNPAINVSPLEIIVLKDFLEVDQTWTQSLTQTTTITGLPPINTPVSIVGKILERDASLTIGATTYTNIIRVELIQTTQGEVNKNYYWFAKDIGIVKYQNQYQTVDTISELQSYIIN